MHVTDICRCLPCVSASSSRTMLSTRLKKPRSCSPPCTLLSSLTPSTFLPCGAEGVHIVAEGAVASCNLALSCSCACKWTRNGNVAGGLDVQMACWVWGQGTMREGACCLGRLGTASKYCNLRAEINRAAWCDSTRSNCWLTLTSSNVNEMQSSSGWTCVQVLQACSVSSSHKQQLGDKHAHTTMLCSQTNTS